MKKLKLQMQVSIDGYISPLNHKDWLVWSWGSNWTWDNGLRTYFIDLIKSVSCILLSRKMAQEGFIDHWTSIANEVENPQSAFAKVITESEKVIFSHTMETALWPNSSIAKGDFVSEVMTLKRTSRKDIIVFGGSTFVSSLIRAQLIDEYYLFVNPVALGNGLKIFNEMTNLKLIKAQSFSCGVTVLKYIPG